MAIVKKVKIEESQQMWAIEGSPGPKAAYRGGGIILTPAILLEPVIFY